MESCLVTRRYTFDGKIHSHSYCIMSRQRSVPSTCMVLGMNDELDCKLVVCSALSAGMTRTSARVQGATVLIGYCYAS
jgi:hypothetical protein